jgi:SET domain-containing protein
MNLDAQHFIDATRRGNIMRFTNHSCEPNAVLQTWTVNGEPRVGFYAKRRIGVDEELNIDYQCVVVLLRRMLASWAVVGAWRRVHGSGSG